MTLHVAFTLDHRYLPWCAVAVRSCLDHTGPGLTVHLLHDGDLDGHPGVDRLTEMVADAGGEVRVHRVDAAELDALQAIDRFGRAVWLRFFLPDVLPDVGRVLYLDPDTLVTAALRPLLDTELGDAPIAAVANVYSADQRQRLDDLGLADHRGYFNSGVLLLDLDRLRAEHATSELLRTVRTRSSELAMPDQDALNLVFEGRWHRLHPQWNAQNKLWEDPAAAEEYFGAAAAQARTAPAILHFEGPSVCKPWHALNTHPWRRVWWETLRRTPYAATRPEDAGVATAALRMLPRPLRVRGYFKLVAMRAARTARASDR
jgi:lipopolysaccharide biosynthesis glycosyltransferase